MKSGKFSFVKLFLFLVFAYGMVGILSNYIERIRPVIPTDEEEMIILDGGKLKGFCLGLNGLFADYYWMQSLQYVGKKMMAYEKDINIDDLRVLNPKLLYPLLNNATEFDPQFEAVYFFGAVVLPAVSPDDAVKLLKKGIHHNPEDWRFFHYLGFIYWRLGEYEKAASVYEEGSKLQGAPEFMKMMVARLRSEGGSRSTARAIYQELMANAESEEIRKIAILRLMELDSLDAQDAIRRTLKRFQAIHGRCARNWGEILPLLAQENIGSLKVDKKGNLYDPTDAPYILDETLCDVKPDAEKTKLRPAIK
jgi:tetratricopeptide (TPR) repeat protein